MADTRHANNNESSSEDDSVGSEGAEEGGGEDDSYQFIHGTLRDSWARKHFEAEAPEISPEEIIRGEVIGGGTFGTVYKGQCRGEIVAIKELKDSDIANLEEFRKEVAIMSHLRHRNIVLLMGACTIRGHCCILTEFATGGDLDHLLKDKTKELPLIQKLKILKDVALAMNWLHCSKPPIIHRDLKPSNIMLAADMTAKVGDMGLSAVQASKQIEGDGAGSYLWMAPEALLYEPHTEKADLYSFAIVMWQIFAWNPDPYKKYLDAGDLDGLIQAVCKRRERPQLPSDLHPSLVELIELGWHQDPQMRPTFAEMVVKLDDAIITTAFVDETAAKFWKRNWRGKVEEKRVVRDTRLFVPFDKFAACLYSRVGVRLPAKPEESKKYLCLKAVVCAPNFPKPTVSIERFALVTKWFGQLIRDDLRTIIDEIHDVVACPWFHGDIGKDEAVSILMGQLQDLDEKAKKTKNGVFLVRCSLSEPVHQNPFTISQINSKGEIIHQRVLLKNGKLFIRTKDKTGDGEIGTRKGLKALIQDLEKAKSSVKTPAPRTRYSDIFATDQNVQDKGYLDTLQTDKQ